MRCFLEGYGPCRGPISREHFISKSILSHNAAGSSTAKIGGLRWQPLNILQNIGIGSLQSKILCSGHNSELSLLDSSAGELFHILHCIDKDRASTPCLSRLNGLHIERWLLKVLFGGSASGSLNSSEPPEQWKALLTGADWPPQWGLYLFRPEGPQIFSSDLLVETMVNPATGEILAGKFMLAGVIFILLLGTPDHPEFWGVHRPSGLSFMHGIEERRIEFLWPHQVNETVIITNIGSTTTSPSYLDEWKE